MIHSSAKGSMESFNLGDSRLELSQVNDGFSILGADGANSGNIMNTPNHLITTKRKPAMALTSNVRAGEGEISDRGNI